MRRTDRPPSWTLAPGFLCASYLAFFGAPPGRHGDMEPRATRDSIVQIVSGGWLLIGTYTAPTPRGTSHAAVLLLNRAGGDRRAYTSTAEALAREGIASLRLDLRGHGESTNLGRFVPSAPGMDTLLQETPRDVAAGLDWLSRQPGVDPTRLGLVGASYSGELAVLVSRSWTRIRAHAMLSPGSLSEESIRWLDSQHRRWLFIASRQERTAATRSVIAEVLATSRWADIWLWEPQAHATQLLEALPEVPVLLAHWFAARFRDSI